jgi:hypothetical protein
VPEETSLESWVGQAEIVLDLEDYSVFAGDLAPEAV